MTSLDGHKKRSLLKRFINMLFRKLTGVNLAQMKMDLDAISGHDAAQMKMDLDAISGRLLPLEHLLERFRTRVHMSSTQLLPNPDSGKLTYGYKDATSDSTYRDFEDVFRGDESFIKDRLRVYEDFFKKGDSILEIGCGRGEFLELLSEQQVHYTGVDLDESMVSRCKDKGLSPIVHEDFEVYLDGVEPSVFDGIFSFQFIEHISSEKIMDYFKKCHAALKDDGVLVVETVNPYSIEAFRTFHVDLTHQKILYPEVLLVFAKMAGFSKASIFYPNNNGFDETQYDVAGEYAVIAYK
jgi:2-polyprenyl-3-methyl-5-hydroxy-6-metoxy-1,4-benzoquinol methylase